MTRKDYIALAKALRMARIEALKTESDWAVAGVDESIHRISTVLAEDNDRFDPMRFLAACQSGQGM